MYNCASCLFVPVSSKAHAAKNIAQPPVNSTNVEKLILDARLPYAAKRPKCNSILHLFDAWLFDASLAGVKLHPTHAAPGQFCLFSFCVCIDDVDY